jgi:hypothetical protein
MDPNDWRELGRELTGLKGSPAAPATIEELVSQLRDYVPVLQAIADRAYGAASLTEFHLRRRSLERVGIRATDLIHALSQLVDL